MFDFGHITSLQAALLIASVALTLLSMIALLMRLLPLRRHLKRTTAPEKIEGAAPSAAVVVFARDDAEALADLLAGVLNQNYAPGYEVIVVNDGDSAEVRDTVQQLMQVHRNLYFTNAPDGARNLSRKKLALTLGIKAAKSDVVVLTTSSARLRSDKWLAGMMQHFDESGAVEIVIGYAAAPAYDDNASGARARSFDSVADSLGWVGPAVSARTWRGIEHNLAYRRDVFFDNKGFSKHLNLRDGDDDIFISEIATRDNVAMELSPDTMVEVPGDNMPRTFRERLSRRRFTKKFIRHRPRVVGTVCAAAYTLAPLPLVVAICFGNLSPMFWAFFVAIIVGWYCAGLLWNPAVKALGGRRLRFSTPLLAFTRPVRIAVRTLRTSLHHAKRYTWE